MHVAAPVAEDDVELVERGLEGAELQTLAQVALRSRLHVRQAASEDLDFVVAAARTSLRHMGCRGRTVRHPVGLVTGFDFLPDQIEAGAVLQSADHGVPFWLGQGTELL